MIQVEVEKIHSGDFGDEILNGAAEAVAEGLQDEFKDAKCANCVDSRGVVTIHADRQESMYVTKSNFCCKDFEDRIQISVN